MKLKIEPIPNSTWGISLANLLPEREWNIIRRRVYKKADYICEVCKDSDTTLNAHEVWKFNNKSKIQRLLKVQCLCNLCHDVKHFGRSTEVYDRDYIEQLVDHWCRVNRKKRKDFTLYISEVMTLNRKRANVTYTVKVGRRTLGTDSYSSSL